MRKLLIKLTVFEVLLGLTMMYFWLLQLDKRDRKSLVSLRSGHGRCDAGTNKAEREQDFYKLSHISWDAAVGRKLWLSVLLINVI